MATKKIVKKKPKVVKDKKVIKKAKVKNVKKDKIKNTKKKDKVVPVKKVKKTATSTNVRVGNKTPELLRGFKDILPKDSFYWRKIQSLADQISQAYGFVFSATPILEEASLFIRSIGRGTDVVDKEMYLFEDRDGSKVCLRPEATASYVRAFINHGMQSLSQPVKFWYLGPMFRHDRPQAGRFRQFYQYGCETFGVRDSAIEAELISAGYNFLKDLGIKATVYINSLGTVEDRQNYLIELVGYLRTKRAYLCEDCKKRITKNPLRVLDCKNTDCKQVLEEAPQIIDWLSESSKNYFMKVLEYLDEVDIPYVLQPTLVRGLDYYTDTVFEFYEDEVNQESQNALGGGGRYDLLVKELGGQDTPAAGFAFGIERIISVLRRQKEEGKLSFSENRSKFFLAQLGEQARMRSLKIIEELRRAGIFVEHNLGKTSLKSQMELADKLGTAYSIIIGQKEVQDGTVILRDMESGNQEIIDQKKLKSALEKKLSKV